MTVLSVPTVVDGHQYLATAAVQTTDPDNPTYQHDAKALLDGFQVRRLNAAPRDAPTLLSGKP